jgi:acetyltransferase-like isoleucine patch superfamily enzyme
MKTLRHIKSPEKLKGPYMESPAFMVSEDVEFGENVSLSPFVNLWGCKIGDNTSIGAFAEIGRGVTVGSNCKIAAFAFIPPGVTIGNDVFIGPHAVFTNDKYPRSKGDWTMERTVVEDGASIGAGCVILPGVRIGKRALVGAGTVLTQDVIDDELTHTRFTTRHRIKE